jgi:hypothetical protein
MNHEYASNKWTSVLLATSQPAPPEIASIANARQSQLRSRLENSSAARLLRQPTTVEDSVACTEPLPQGKPGGRKEDRCYAAWKNAKSRQLASLFDERSARYPAGAPG